MKTIDPGQLAGGQKQALALLREMLRIRCFEENVERT